MSIVSVGLCEGRHPMPVHGYIFPAEIDPLDIAGMRKQINDYFDSHLEWGKHLRASQWSYDDYYVETSDDHVHLYVSGLTVAVAEVIRYCYNHGVRLTLYHYDRNTGGYYPQYM